MGTQSPPRRTSRSTSPGVAMCTRTASVATGGAASGAGTWARAAAVTARETAERTTPSAADRASTIHERIVPASPRKPSQVGALGANSNRARGTYVEPSSATSLR